MAHRTPPKPRCRDTAFDELECLDSWHAELIPRWKAAIPARYRSYDPAYKAWRFTGQYRDVAIALLLEYHPAADVPTRSRTHTTTPPKAGADYFTVLHLLPTAPPEVVDAAFRALAKKFHPDKGGDPVTMRRLNEARDALAKRLSA